MVKLNVGIIEYINSLPFCAGIDLGHISLNANIIKGIPSKLNHLLQEGSLDLSLISCSEYLKYKEDYALVSGLCIGAFPKVMSVVLYTKKALYELDQETIVITKQSAASALLLKALAKEYWNINPIFKPLLDVDYAEQFNAFVLIGDDCLRKPEFPGYSRIDLCEAWYHATGLPFTFAVFAARREVQEKYPEDLDHCIEKIQASLHWAYQHPQEIERLAKEKSGLSSSIISEYFQVLRYRLTPKQKEGLDLFEAKIKMLPEFIAEPQEQLV